MGRWEKEAFRSPAHILDAVSVRPVNDAWRGKGRSSDKREEWGAVRSFAEALDKAKEGYTEVTEQMKDTFEAAKKYIYARVEPKHAMPVNDYVGSTPNVTRAILGLPKDMRRVNVEEKKTPGVHLVYEGGVNCGYADKDLAEYGARMLALVSLCIRQQIPVKLSITDSTTGLLKGDGTVTMEVTIKEYEDAANIRKIAYWIAHPSVFRRINFAWMETSPIIERHCYGYGYPISNTNSECEEIREKYEAEGAFWFSSRDFKSDEDILKAWERIAPK